MADAQRQGGRTGGASATHGKIRARPFGAHAVTVLNPKLEVATTGHQSPDRHGQVIERPVFLAPFHRKNSAGQLLVSPGHGGCPGEDGLLSRLLDVQSYAKSYRGLDNFENP